MQLLGFCKNYHPEYFKLFFGDCCWFTHWFFYFSYTIADPSEIKPKINASTGKTHCSKGCATRCSHKWSVTFHQEVLLCSSRRWFLRTLESLIYFMNKTQVIMRFNWVALMDHYELSYIYWAFSVSIQSVKKCDSQWQNEKFIFSGPPSVLLSFSRVISPLHLINNTFLMKMWSIITTLIVKLIWWFSCNIL